MIDNTERRVVAVTPGIVAKIKERQKDLFGGPHSHVLVTMPHRLSPKVLDLASEMTREGGVVQLLDVDHDPNEEVTA